MLVPGEREEFSLVSFVSFVVNLSGIFML